jgi:2-dehydropantoate 2-reductase
MIPSFRIAVVGAGAIGCYYGAKLASLGRDVRFLMRGDVEEIRRFGIRIRGKGEDSSLTKVNYHASADEIGPSDLVLIAVKATSNGDLLTLIPPLLHEKTMLLTLQNGFGNEEFLAENFGAQRVLGALCFVCLNRVSPGVIELYDPGRVAIGEYDRPPQLRTQDVADEFKRCGVVCDVVENLTLERWRKLVWNIPFNGLSVAAGGIDTQAILSDAHLRSECVALMDEVIRAANKCGFPLPAAAAFEQIKRTESMGAYKPSTLIDFQAGRPLEIEAIWGEPLRRASAAGADTPRLQTLYEKLRAIDTRQSGEVTAAQAHG